MAGALSAEGILSDGRKGSSKFREGKLIAVDGKSLRRSFEHAWDTSGIFNEGQSRVRKGHGAENLSQLGPLSANLLRLNPAKRSVKGQRTRPSANRSRLI